MKRAGLLVTAVVAGSLTAVAAPAQAVVPTEAVVYTDGLRIIKAASDLSNPETVITETGWHVRDLTSSPDGKRIAYVRYSGSHEQVVSRDVGGTGFLLVRDNHHDDRVPGAVYHETSLSYSGLLTSVRAVNSDLDVHEFLGGGVDVASDPVLAMTLAPNVPTDNLPEGGREVLTLDRGYNIRWGYAGSGNRGYERVTGINEDVASFAVSHDGKRIAWDTRPSFSAKASVIRAGDFDGYAVTNVRTLVDAPTGTNQNTTPVAFSHDGDLVYFRSAQNTVMASSDWDISSVPFDGGAVTALTDTDDVDETLPVGVAFDGTAPGAPTVYGALLEDRPVLRWAVPGDADLAVVRITRTAPGLPTVVRDVLPVAAELVDGSTTPEVTYTYTYAAVDRYGNTSPPVTQQMTAYRPFLRAPFLSTSASTTTSFPVVFPASDHARVWTKDFGGFRAAPDPAGYVPWNVTPSGTHVFGVDGGSVSEQGHAYGFLIQVFDAYGNASKAHAVRTTVPMDCCSVYGDPFLYKNGDTFFDGRLQIYRPGTHAAIPARGRIAIIGSTCPTCGVMAVHGNGHVWRFNTYSRTRHDRVVLAILLAPTDGYHAWTISPEPSGTHRDVALDALAYL